MQSTQPFRYEETEHPRKETCPGTGGGKAWPGEEFTEGLCVHLEQNGREERNRS